MKIIAILCVILTACGAVTSPESETTANICTVEDCPEGYDWSQQAVQPASDYVTSNYGTVNSTPYCYMSAEGDSVCHIHTTLYIGGVALITCEIARIETANGVYYYTTCRIGN